MPKRQNKFVVVREFVSSLGRPVRVHGTWSSLNAAQAFADRAEDDPETWYAYVVDLGGKLVRDIE